MNKSTLRPRKNQMALHKETILALIIICLGAYLSFATDEFLSLENLFDILLSYSFLGIMAVGMLLVLISGGIDISVTAIATVGQYAMALYILKYGGNLFLAFLISGVIGIVLGCINGFLIDYLKVPAIIVTIATLNIYHGVLITLTKGRWIYGFPRWFNRIPSLFAITVESGTEYSFSLPIVLLIALYLFTAFLLKRTSLGRQIYALGGNAEAAQRLGIKIRRLRIFVYGFMGLMSGIAAVVQAQLVQTVAPNAIVGRELDVVAAVVLGGASLAGGTGSVLGTALGVSLVAIMHNGLTLLGVSSYWHQIFLGVVILISVGITAYSQFRSTPRRVIQLDVREGS
ncbi:MAG TPA: ABC transporter permease [Firmicutes bacterium]|nr:ABC transporter permease [Bacillota bacterium]